MEKLTPETEADQIFTEFYGNNQPFTFEIKPTKQNCLFFVNKLLKIILEQAGCEDENPAVIHYKQVKEELLKIAY